MKHSLPKRLIAMLPRSVQRSIKHIYFRRQIRRGRFTGDEPEYWNLHRWVSAGDWVLDIGANVGHYACRLSELVGPDGRVIAVEPIPESFALLCQNSMAFSYRNITLLNLAASKQTGVVSMTIPTFDNGTDNYFMASITDSPSGQSVIAVPLDILKLHDRLTFVKIDVEGHEYDVIEGLRATIERHKPVLVIESNDARIESQLVKLGYRAERYPNSPNILFLPR